FFFGKFTCFTKTSLNTRDKAKAAFRGSLAEIKHHKATVINRSAERFKSHVTTKKYLSQTLWYSS
ncbi:MAG: hypothetical protein ACOYM1_11200, partial [Methylovulum sp.]